MAEAKSLGFEGWGGGCWTAAVAINRLLFAGRGTYTIGVNAALESVDYLIGHAAVTVEDEQYGYVHLDADGRPKGDEDIESWGQLDFDDEEWRELAHAQGLEWDEEAALTAVLLDVDEEELIQRGAPGQLELQIEILEQAIARVEASPSVSGFGMGR